MHWRINPPIRGLWTFPLEVILSTFSQEVPSTLPPEVLPSTLPPEVPLSHSPSILAIQAMYLSFHPEAVASNPPLKIQVVLNNQESSVKLKGYYYQYFSVCGANANACIHTLALNIHVTTLMEILATVLSIQPL